MRWKDNHGKEIDATFEESDTESKDSSMEIDFFRDYTSDNFAL